MFGDEIGRRRLCIKSAWWRTCQRAKIADLHFHDLRREAGSRWMDAGIPLATIQRWLGHSDPKLTAQHYTDLGVEDLRDAIERAPVTEPERKKEAR